MAYAVHLGYDRINIIGFDNSIFAHVAVDEANRMWVLGDTHFYSSQGGAVELAKAEISRTIPRGMADWLFDFSLCFYDLQVLFSGRPIVNLDECSFTDAFPKVRDASLIRPRATP